MRLMLGYINKKGAHTTMLIKTNEVPDKLKWLAKQGYEAVLWEEDNRQNEVGWVYKHDEAGWVWNLDNDIFNQTL